MSGITANRNGNISAKPAKVAVSNELQEFINLHFTEQDKEYLKTLSSGVSTLAVFEDGLQTKLKQAKAKLRATPEFKEVMKLKTSLKNIKMQTAESTVKAKGVIESRLHGYRSGEAIEDKVVALLQQGEI